MKTNKIITLILAMVACIGFSEGVPFSPQGNVDLKDFYNMTSLNYFETFKMVSGHNITGVYEMSSTLVDTTNLEADNLESDLDGTGYNITAAYFKGGVVGTAGTYENLTATNSWLTNLESDLDGTGQKIIIGSLNVSDDINSTNARITNVWLTNLESSLDGTGYTITAGTFTDGTATLTGGSLKSADDVNATDVRVTNIYPTNLESDMDGTGYTLTIKNVKGATDVNSTYLNGNSTWKHQSYPAACSASFGVSAIGDSNTCTHFLLGTGDTVTGNYTVYGLVNATSLEGDSITDGTLTIASGDLTGVGSVVATDVNVSSDLVVDGLSSLVDNLTVGTDALVVDVNSNMVGIGKSDPSYALHIDTASDGLRVESGGSITANLINDDGTYTFIARSGNNGYAANKFYTNLNSSQTNEPLIQGYQDNSNNDQAVFSSQQDGSGLDYEMTGTGGTCTSGKYGFFRNSTSIYVCENGVATDLAP